MPGHPALERIDLEAASIWPPVVWPTGGKRSLEALSDLVRWRRQGHQSRLIQNI
jgi:hypothetical protein